MKKFLLLFSLFIGGVTFSQVSQTLTIGSGTSSSATRGPIQRSSSTSSSVYSRASLVYTATELSSLTSTASISSINFDLGSTNQITASGNAIMKIYMKNSNATAAPAVNETWADVTNGATLVGTYTFNTTNNFPGSKGFLSFDLDTDFDYTGAAIEVFVDWDCSGLTSVNGNANLLFSGDGSLNWNWSSTTHTSLIYQSGSSSAPSTFTAAGNRKAERVNTQFVYTDPNAENTLIIGTGTSSSATRGPIQRSSSSSSSVYSRASLVYTASELSTLTSNALISKIDFDLGSTNIITASGNAIMKIYMKNSNATEAPAVDEDWTNVINQAVLVGTYTFNTLNNFPGAEGFLSFDLDTDFNYTGNTLEVAVDWDCSALIPSDAGQPNLLFSGDGSLQWNWDSTSHTSLIYQSGSSSAPSTLSSASNRKAERVNTQFVYKVLRSSIWDGSTDNNWHTAANWSTNKIPTELVVVSIPTGLTNYPTANAAVSTFSITMAAGTSFIANSTVAGNVTYKRNITTPVGGVFEGWYLMASPVASQAYGSGNTWLDDNGIAIGNSPNRGVATYNNTVTTSNWSYSDGSAATFASGLGYSIKRTSDGDVAFTGTINTTDITNVAVTMKSGASGTDYNLVGNPYTSYLNSQTFLNLAANSSILTSDIFVWNSANKMYETKMSSEGYVIAPGQAFFVKATSDGNITFEKSNQSHETDNFKKSATQKIVVTISDGASVRFAELRYNENATTSYDRGYDGETFGGIANELNVFTELLANNNGTKYQIQSLPNSDFENMVVPVGVIAKANKEITFSIEALNLPDGINVFLEDKLTNTFTNLNEGNYKVNTTEALSSTGRFYLHTKSSALNLDAVVLSNVTIFKSNNSTLRIAGLETGIVSINLYNVLGKNVMNSKFDAKTVNDISLPKLSAGVYIVKLQSEQGAISKKIILE